MFPCLKCSKEFRFHSKLIIHFRTHTGHKPYVCRMCEHASATKGALKKHMKAHTGLKRSIATPERQLPSSESGGCSSFSKKMWTRKRCLESESFKHALWFPARRVGKASSAKALCWHTQGHTQVRSLSLAMFAIRRSKENYSSKNISRWSMALRHYCSVISATSVSNTNLNWKFTSRRMINHSVARFAKGPFHSNTQCWTTWKHVRDMNARFAANPFSTKVHGTIIWLYNTTQNLLCVLFLHATTLPVPQVYRWVISYTITQIGTQQSTNSIQTSSMHTRGIVVRLIPYTIHAVVLNQHCVNFCVDEEVRSPVLHRI